MAITVPQLSNISDVNDADLLHIIDSSLSNADRRVTVDALSTHILTTNTIDANTVTGFTVGVNVPSDAVFTDTNNFVSGGSITSGILTLNRSGLSDLTISGIPDASNFVTISGDQSIGGTKNFTGALQIGGTTISTGSFVLTTTPQTIGGTKTFSNTIISTNGIRFDSSVPPANVSTYTLDDYEEGTFTPTFNSITAGGTITGNYTKIGNTVVVEITAGSTSSGAGVSVTISLPFTASGVAIGSYTSTGGSVGFGAASGTTVTLLNSTGGFATPSTINGTGFFLSITYKTNA